MTKTPRLTEQPGQSKMQPSSLSAPMLIFVTALDTTWRAFVPTIGGTFLGIGIDHLFGIAPIGTIVCLVLGFAASAFLIAQQLITVRRRK